MPRALEGLRVLDLSEGLAGAVAGMILADHGADLVKVEPLGGDPVRDLAGWRVWHRGKRSLVLDWQQPAGRDVLLTLLAGADALVVGAPPDRLAARGLDYTTLHDRFPELVYATISGYGQTGADRGRPGAGELVEARLGLQDAQGGARDGPIFLGWPLAEYGGAFVLAIGLVAALFARTRTGVGQLVDASLLGGAAFLTGNRWSRGEGAGFEPGPSRAASYRVGMGNRRAVVELFECGDGEWLQIHTAPRGGFNRLMRAVGLDALADPAKENEAQPSLLPPEVADQMWRDLERIFRQRPRDDWLEILTAADLPANPALPPGACFGDAQIVANDLIASVPDPDLGSLRAVGIVHKFRRTPGRVAGPAPRVGEHTRAILTEADYSAAELARLRRDGVIALEDREGAEPARKSDGGRGPAKPLPDRKSGSAAARLPSPIAAYRHALEGVTVLDFGFYLAGPIIARLLADLGARVIKVEEPSGDPRRGFGSAFLFVQRGKEDIAVNLKTPEGRAIVHALVRRADAVVHNLRVGAAERLGIDYATLGALNPRLIYCHTTGYGARGPRAHQPTMEPLHSAFAGLMHLSGGRGNRPVTYLTSMDHVSGMNGALAVIMALHERARSGQGQFVEVPQNGISLLCTSDVYFAGDRKSAHLDLDPEQTGHGPLNRLYRTAEGWLCIACRSQPLWERLCRAMDLPALALDERFATTGARERHAAALAEVLGRRFLERPTVGWLARFDDVGVPAEAPRDPGQVSLADDPENLATGLVAEYAHPRFGRFREIGVPVRLSETPGRNAAPAPLLGQHTRQILAELGYSDTWVAELQRTGAVAWEDAD
jgi:crotonobetainyl-CoA:carnitine CoA-transferase CaiB-like acyl-CoA transferase